MELLPDTTTPEAVAAQVVTPGKMLQRAIRTGSSMIVPEWDPWIIMRSIEGHRISLVLTTLGEPQHRAVLVWPGEQGMTDGFSEGFADDIRDTIRDNCIANVAAARQTRLSPFPGGDRVAIVGRGPTAAEWHMGDKLTLPQGASGWEPNLTIYLNQAAQKKRPLSSRSAQNWLGVVDRRVGPAELGEDTFRDLDGVIVSVAAHRDLIPECARRGIQIHMIAPPQYRRIIELAGALPEDGATYIVHQHGAGCTLMALVGLMRKGKGGSVLDIGLDGFHPFPGEEDPNAAQELERLYTYNDMACANAGMAFYLHGFGIKVHTLSPRLGSLVTPYGHALSALRKWQRHHEALGAMVEMRDAFARAAKAGEGKAE